MVDNKHNHGFALLVSLIVVSVVLSVGLVILDLTIKQVRLAVTTKDSEIAFHAANAGMECGRFWRREVSADTLSGATLTNISCFGQLADDTGLSPSGTAGDINSVPVTLASGSGGDAYQYEYEFSWGPGTDRCTRINMVSINAPISESNAVIDIDRMNGDDGSPAVIAGYPGSTDVVCESGSQCTIIAVLGYNQACPSGSFGYGVVERKVLLEF